MTELTVSFSVEIRRTPAPSPHAPYPQVMLLLAVLVRARSFALVLAVDSWSRRGTRLEAGPGAL